MQCRGPESGFPMTSHRAEACGTWSLLLATAKSFHHHNQDPQKALSAARDNKALVSKINELLTREHPALPNDTFDSDLDATDEIMLLLRTGEVKSLKWIESHQDRDKDHNELSIDAKLNCEADSLLGSQVQTPQDCRILGEDRFHSNWSIWILAPGECP